MSVSKMKISPQMSQYIFDLMIHRDQQAYKLNDSFYSLRMANVTTIEAAFFSEDFDEITQEFKINGVSSLERTSIVVTDRFKKIIAITDFGNIELYVGINEFRRGDQMQLRSKQPFKLDKNDEIAHLSSILQMKCMEVALLLTKNEEIFILILSEGILTVHKLRKTSERKGLFNSLFSLSLFKSPQKLKKFYKSYLFTSLEEDVDHFKAIIFKDWIMEINFVNIEIANEASSTIACNKVIDLQKYYDKSALQILDCIVNFHQNKEILVILQIQTQESIVYSKLSMEINQQQNPQLVQLCSSPKNDSKFIAFGRYLFYKYFSNKSYQIFKKDIYKISEKPIEIYSTSDRNQFVVSQSALYLATEAQVFIINGEDMDLQTKNEYIQEETINIELKYQKETQLLLQSNLTTENLNRLKDILSKKLRQIQSIDSSSHSNEQSSEHSTTLFEKELCLHLLIYILEYPLDNVVLQILRNNYNAFLKDSINDLQKILTIIIEEEYYLIFVSHVLRRGFNELIVNYRYLTATFYSFFTALVNICLYKLLQEESKYAQFKNQILRFVAHKISLENEIVDKIVESQQERKYLKSLTISQQSLHQNIVIGLYCHSDLISNQELEQLIQKLGRERSHQQMEQFIKQLLHQHIQTLKKKKIGKKNLLILKALSKYYEAVKNYLQQHHPNLLPFLSMKFKENYSEIGLVAGKLSNPRNALKLLKAAYAEDKQFMINDILTAQICKDLNIENMTADQFLRAIKHDSFKDIPISKVLWQKFKLTIQKKPGEYAEHEKKLKFK